jgi:VanZ family protein
VKFAPVARRCALLLVVSGIWYLSDRPSWQVLPPLFPFQDKVYHLVEYAFLGGVLWMNRDLARGKVFLLMVAGALLGAMDEIHQSWVPGRDCSVPDFIADCVGVATWLAAAALRRRRASPAALDAGDRSCI